MRRVTIGKISVYKHALLLLFKCANHRSKRPFVSTASEALVGALMTLGEATSICALAQRTGKKFASFRVCLSLRF